MAQEVVITTRTGVLGVVTLVTAGFCAATRLPAFQHWIPQGWWTVLPVLAAWIVGVWGVAGPLWGLGVAGLLALILANVALMVRAPWDVAALVLGLLTSTGLLAALGHRYLSAAERAAQAAADDAAEEANALEAAVGQIGATTMALSARLARYAALRAVTESFTSQTADLETLLKTIVQQTLSVADPADVALIYLMEAPQHGLALRAVQWRREAPRSVKRKTGDLFDEWVLRQGQPLLVRDVRHDFRFPAEAAPREDRLIGSLIAAPLISAQRVLGVLRAESATPQAFSGDALRLLSIVADLAAMAVENTRLYLRTAELAITDDLTGLAVPRYFDERVDEELARARRRNSPVSILLIDLDHFKTYNDTYGHSAGDKLLRTIAQLLRQSLGPGDLIARHGGEEFVVLLSGMTRGVAREQAEAIRRTIAAHEIVLRQGKARVTVSVGVATFPDDGVHREPLFQIADQRLYRAKNLGRNQVCDA